MIEDPRTFEADVAKLEEAKVDAVFAPDWKEMYPESPPYGTYVTIEGIDDLSEGRARPGFFRGVATVVTKLFNIVQPNKAFFGQKDGLQSIVIHKTVRDLNMDLDVVICPTVREADGLAMSSRNVYLDASQRAAAPTVYRSLQAAEHLFKEKNERRVKALKDSVLQVFAADKSGQLLYPPEYVSFADIDTGAELPEDGTVATSALVSIAVRSKKTRLIDNVILK
jgi:pantoate--beta-alanine ligase